MSSFQTFLVLMTVAAISAFPFPKPDDLESHEADFNATAEFEDENQEFLKIRDGYVRYGDLVLPENYYTEGATFVQLAKRWPESKVPYAIDRSLAKWKPMILDAMKEYHTKTCVRFVERTNQKNYIYLTATLSGCYSYLGVQGGKQEVSLQANACTYLGTIIHELGHAIGLVHEHQRSDRDRWINVFMNNVQQGATAQFTVLKPNENIIATAYDHESIMHYGETAFSKDGVAKTMTAKNGKKLLNPYDKRVLTTNDVITVRGLYKCT